MALGTRGRFQVTCALVLSSVSITVRYERTSTFERPLHGFLIALLLSALFLFAASSVVPNDSERPRGILSILVEGRKSSSSSEESCLPKESHDPLSTISSRKRRALLASIITCIIVRADILRRIVQKVECSQEAVESNLPLLLAAIDFLSVHRSEYHATGKPVAKSTDVFNYVRSRYLLPTVIVALGAILSRGLLTRSTYICPSISHGWLIISSLQYIGVVLDAVIITCVIRLLTACQSLPARLVCLSDILLVSVYGLGVTCSLAISLRQELRGWAFDCSLSFLGNAMFDGFILSLFLLFVCVLSLELNPVLISVIANFSCISCQQLTGAWINPPRFSSDPQVLRSLSSILIQFGTINTIHMDGVLETSQSAAFTKVERRFWSFLVVLISLAVLPQLGPSESLDEHTIDILMKDAISSHDHYMKQASSSATLQAAVLEYRARYHCHPPPNFDKWFEFATSRNAVVIDDYDQIWNDLRPFMTIAPSVLRNATNDVLLNPWNDIAGLSIRNGSTYVGPHIVGTHRWMLDGISAMIDKFSNWLPDMDLGFNIDDECRVVAPWRDIDAARRQVIAVGMNPQSTQDHDFSDMLSFLGQPLWMNESAVLEYGPTKLFPDESFQQSLYDYGATNCAPGSPARSTYKWNRLNLYPEYATPYSDGHFVRNWSLSGNMCFQPDMAHLHGFHMSPATFKTSRKLQPVFSQSKVPGYNDILYPSPWNYVDKVSYNAEQDIPFADKKNTLFWRGSTSEGMSLDGTWQGMQRQRFVYLANNNSAGTRIPMLLPHGNKFRYKSVRYDKLKEQLRIDASLVDRIQRCSFEDCRAQEVELGLSPPVDFQTHWKYRYLADFDGAGFSGRFLPFLYSKSVPFKVALFREWYDDRLMPWMHFVPLDSRLHGVYSTLAYFAGYRDGSEKEVVGTKSAARLKQGEWIAEQGSAWAKKVLRKEDMEIYFFRLLLEWGRVIDDRRDDIGFLVV